MEEAGTSFEEIFGEDNEWHVVTANQSPGEKVTVFDRIVLGPVDGGTGVGFVITEIIRNPTTNEVTLKWVSSPGATYSVESSTDLKEWLELQDGVESQGTETTYTEPDASAENYFRVRRE
jgi:hypothetical protein